MYSGKSISHEVHPDRFTPATLRSDHRLLFLHDGTCLWCSALDRHTTSYLCLLIELLADAKGISPVSTASTDRFPRARAAAL